MALVYYYLMFTISLIVVIVYAFIFHKHFDANITIMVALVPILNLGFLLMAKATNIEEALATLKFSYIGGCFLLLSAMILIFHICGIQVKPWVRIIFYVASVTIFSLTLTIGYNDIFYKGIPTLASSNGASYITDKQYGIGHTLFYVLVGIYYAITVATLIYSIIKKKQVPISVLILVILSVTIAMIGFFGGRLSTLTIELLPASYNLGTILYLIIASRLRLYDASDSVIDSLVQRGETGFVSFDNKLRYLGSNETAKKMIPELNELRIDHTVNRNEWLKSNLIPWIEEYELNHDNNKQYAVKGDKTYLVNINRLVIGRTNRGYQLLLTDDTANQQYIKLIQKYNNQLEAEVEKKTAHVIAMQEKLVLGMATMVEGRDNSTGGHIKRTSDCVRILVEEIKKDNSLELSESFCNNLIKAAPMHDLGKIAVDDVILRKPGKFTPEEFEIMKTHAAEGARIVKQILEGTDDVEFMNIAVNVAHYHHERWDGSGYPKGLKGEEIPLEARIMAIADVYDALVSKRVYKDSMSFEAANSIIMEGMVKHFDKRLEPYYVKARPELEEYYRHVDK